MKLEHRDSTTREARQIGSPSQDQIDAALADLRTDGAPVTLALVGGDVITIWRLEDRALLVNMKAGSKQWARRVAPNEAADDGLTWRVDEVGSAPWRATLRAQPLYDGPPLSTAARPSADAVAADDSAAQLAQRLDAEERASVVPPVALAPAPGLATNTIYGLAPSFVAPPPGGDEVVQRAKSAVMLPMYGAPPPEVLRRRDGQTDAASVTRRRRWVFLALAALVAAGVLWLTLRS